jgi:polysaccharide export outer membrane protein
MELENRKIQWDYEALKQKLAQAQLAADQANSGPTPAKIAGSVAFLQEETYKAQLNVLQNEVALYERKIAQLQQQIGSQSNPDQSQLDQLRANKQTLDMFDAELTKINKLIEEIRLSRPSTEAAATNSKNRVFVTGRVQRSGDLQYDKPLTVLQALALAGGFQEYAKTDAISIIRVNGDSTTLLRFNYSDVIKGINSSQNIYLTNGDVVVVP